MNHEVLVIGGGIGGLTVAALLAAGGVDVCLFERQSRVGGCVADCEHLGYRFEPTAGLYAGWEPDGIYEEIFSALPVKRPGAVRLSPPYVVRLPDGSEVTASASKDEFDKELRQTFPECAEAAIAFYGELEKLDQADQNSVSDAARAHLARCSLRFRRFIDVQLQTFTQCSADQPSINRVATALLLPRRGLWRISGGAQALADVFAESLKKSGGTLRLDSPVLRLAYASDGRPIGVDLLSGERVLATRAIVSNLTIWDTYGKLIGLARTPSTVSSQLRRLKGWGAYLLFLSMDQLASARLKSHRIVAITDWRSNEPNLPAEAQLVFSVSPQEESRAPEGKVAVTVSTFTDAEEWFSFHQDESAHEQRDQAMMESVWTRLHTAIPELGDSVEVIETATPQTFYESTRRKFGMVGGLCSSPLSSFKSIFPNLFLVGDTISSSVGLAGVCESAKTLADSLALPKVI